MPLSRLDKAPWPAFGGKSGAAPVTWAALGDVNHCLREPEQQALF